MSLIFWAVVIGDSPARHRFVSCRATFPISHTTQDLLYIEYRVPILIMDDLWVCLDCKNGVKKVL
jgi:hypothetical protein